MTTTGTDVLQGVQGCLLVETKHGITDIIPDKSPSLYLTSCSAGYDQGHVDAVIHGRKKIMTKKT